MIEIFIGIIFSLLSIKIGLPFLRKKLIDYPNFRSSHDLPTPTSGGLIFVLNLILIIIFHKSYFLFPLIVLSLVGFLDDIFQIKPIYRFAVQILCSFLIFIKSPFFLSLDSNSYILSFIIFTFFIFCACSIINFFNFMDGIDGLVGGSALVIFITISYIFNININLLIGSIVAFLIFNWHPAKLFMGDVGSTLLGGLFLIFIFQTENFFEFAKIILIGTTLFADSIVCIFLRLIHKQNIFKPHKLHLYQRLVARGFKASTVSLIYVFATFFLSLFYLFTTLRLLLLAAIFVVVCGFVIDKKYAIPFQKILKN